MFQDYDPGNCSASFPRYYYSLTADACIRFLWSGCGGNTNRHGVDVDMLQRTDRRVERLALWQKISIFSNILLLRPEFLM